MTRKLNPKSKSAHTPTPYDQDITDIYTDIGNIARTLETPMISLETAKANAAFIVRACNSHEKLLELIEEAIPLLQAIAGDAEDAGYPNRADNAIDMANKFKSAIAEAEK